MDPLEHDRRDPLSRRLDHRGLARPAPRACAALNWGVAGDTVSDLLHRLDDLPEGAPHPKRVVLLIGTNDLDQDPAHVARAIAHASDVVADRFPASRVLVLSLLPRAGDQLRAKVRAVNARLPKLLDPRRVDHADFTALFADDTGALRPELYTDGLHLTRRGYGPWAAALAGMLPSPP